MLTPGVSSIFIVDIFVGLGDLSNHRVHFPNGRFMERKFAKFLQNFRPRLDFTKKFPVQKFRKFMSPNFFYIWQRYFLLLTAAYGTVVSKKRFQIFQNVNKQMVKKGAKIQMSRGKIQSSSGEGFFFIGLNADLSHCFLEFA